MSFPAYITWSVDPEIFAIPGVGWPVRWYGLAWVAGLLLSQQLMFHIFKREGKPGKDVDSLAVYVILGTLIGARLGHFLFYDPWMFITDPMQIILPPYAGLASHGGAIGILTGLWLFCRRYKYNYLWMVDRLVIAVTITGAFIRFGNLLNSEIIGKPTNVPWAFVFTRIDNVPRHPAQLYEAIYCLVLFALLYWLWNTRREMLGNGFIFGLFLIILFSLRFIDEFLKENQVQFENELVLNMGQILSIPFVLIGIVFLVLAQRRKKAGPATGES